MAFSTQRQMPGRSRAVAARRGRRRPSVAVHARASAAKAVPLPKTYDQLIRQAQESVKAALADGVEIMEVEFPPSGLASAPGDGEGKAEMDESMKYLRQFLNAFRGQAANTRVFFPELAEMRVAKYGKGMDPNAGSPELLPQFGTRTGFQLDYLTKPNMWWEMGLDVGKLDLASRVQPSDQLLIAAYPYFNIQEMISVTEMWEGLQARGDPKPILVFNGELDRIRSGYYNSFIVPRLNNVKRRFMPQLEGVYYLRNIKRPTGSLFRAYPGPWQVIRRNPANDTFRVIYTSEQRPDLRKVALEILPDPTL